MAKRRQITSVKAPEPSNRGPSRRGLIGQGLFAAGAAAAGLSSQAAAQQPAAPASSPSAPPSAEGERRWDYEVDVLVLGSGSVGLAAAIRARDLGAEVLVIDQNFDVGGKLVHTSGWVSLGGGDAIQERDRLGLDPDNLGLRPPLHKPEDLTDTPDLLYADMTDWSVVDDHATAPYRLNDREQHRAWADHAPIVREFLMRNHVRFSRVAATHFGGGVSKARAPYAMMKLAAQTDILAGTISREDAGSSFDERNTPFNPQNAAPDGAASAFGAPGWVVGGTMIARPLEYSARAKGVRFMLARHFDGFIQDPDGQVVGATASYSPRHDPETGELLQSFWKNGNVEETRETIFIRARKGVVIGTGGHMGNVHFRTMFDPRLWEPSFQYGDALMGPRNMDASGVIAAMKIGAALAGLQQGQHHPNGSPRIQNIIGVSARGDAMFPGHPAFKFMGSKGVRIGPAGWEHVIAVNQVGQRFYDESAIEHGHNAARFPPGTSGTREDFTPGDWRNASTEHVRSIYRRSSAVDAALAQNEGSVAPHYASGPIWAIFDAAAVKRGGWELRYPYVADPPNGFFFQADTLEELAEKVTANKHQNMPLKHLAATVARFNAFADAGQDEDFEKPVMHRIEQAPFYAALIPIDVVDSYGGLRINGHAQVVDLEGEVIPGLYAGGEATGGGLQHGIGRAIVHGYIAASHLMGAT